VFLVGFVFFRLDLLLFVMFCCCYVVYATQNLYQMKDDVCVVVVVVVVVVCRFGCSSFPLSMMRDIKNLGKDTGAFTGITST